VQNVAARLIIQIRRSENITDAFLELHWLRIPERIVYKLAVQTYKVLNGSAPCYLSMQLTRVADMLSCFKTQISLHAMSRGSGFFSHNRRQTSVSTMASSNIWNALLDDVAPDIPSMSQNSPILDFI